jgi:hypothetical protein
MAKNRERTKVPLRRKDLYSLVDDDSRCVEDSYQSKYGWSRVSRGAARKGKDYLFM